MCMDKKKKSFLSLLFGNANITIQNSVMEFLKQVFIAFCCYFFFLAAVWSLLILSHTEMGVSANKALFMYFFACLFV